MIALMALDPATLPKDVASLMALLIAADASESRAAAAEARSADLDAEIAHLKLTIAKMKRAEYGAISEKAARLVPEADIYLRASKDSCGYCLHVSSRCQTGSDRASAHGSA